jgi:hypothetical protein
MASYMIVRHNVKDFAVWKRGYEAHKPKRVEAGLTDKHLLQSADDPSEVVLMFEAKDLAKAKKFAASADLKEVMKKVGVTGKPDIYFLKG